MSDRFDLEQQILDCWKIVDDISLLKAQGANTTDMVSLASVYEYKFKALWETFETMCRTKQFVLKENT